MNLRCSRIRTRALLRDAGTVTCLLIFTVLTQTAHAQTGIELNPADGRSIDVFGTSVAIEGDVAVVGAPGWGTSGAERDAGAVYVFRFDGGAWNQEQRIRPSNPRSDDGFGRDVAIDGNRIIVGATGPGTRHGKAFIFRFDGTTWVEEQTLSAMSATTSDFFGTKVAIDGDLALVTDGVDDDGTTSTGAVWAYRFDGTTWNLDQKLTASDGDDGDWLGQSVGLSGTTAIIGAHLDSPTPDLRFRGSAYVYDFDGSSWSETQILTAGPQEVIDARFGEGSDISGNTLMVGASRDPESSEPVGAVYVFRNEGTGWVRTQRLVAQQPGELDLFGGAISLEGDIAVIGARMDLRSTRTDKEGTAFVFKFDGTSWVEQESIKPVDGINNDLFGWDVWTDGIRVIVGAPGHQHGNVEAGAAYIYDVGTLVADEPAPVPRTEALSIETPYPNPSSGHARIGFITAEGGHVRLEIFDMLGRRVSVPVDDTFPPGDHVLEWQNGHLSPGVYLLRLSHGSKMASNTVVLR